MKKKATPRKKTAAGKLAAAVKAVAKKAAAKKPAPKKAAPKQPAAKPAAPQTQNAAVRHGPLHLPSRPEPAYATMHKRDWASHPPPRKIIK